ncbi:MAG TPA: thiamine pyrophosphate-binding protein [bacterium]|nr:thiamine pyrophosphate-binding protein [bacterium]
MGEQVNGAGLLLQAMLRCGVDHVFAVESEAAGPALAALDAAAGDDLEVVKARDEIAAAAMADAFTFRSKKISAVVTGSGGRSLAQVSAVTNAWADKIPLLSISVCDDDAPDFNKGVDRRRFDQTGVFRAVTKWHARAEVVEDIPALIIKGLAESVRGRMGPVHIDIPARLLREAADVDLFAGLTEGARPAFAPRRLRPDPALVEKAVDELFQARRPLCFIGAGVMRSGAEATLAAFLTKTGIPVTTSMAGMGGVSSDHECFIGGPSYAAGEAFHRAIKKADCVLALGTAFGGLEGFGKPPLWNGRIKFIHVDIDPLQIGLNVSPAVPVQADVNTFLTELAAAMERHNFRTPAAWGEWRSELLALKKGRYARLLKEAYRDWPAIHQGRLAHELGKKVAQDDLLMVIDGGNTALYAAMYAPPLKPGQSFFPYGMAALGAGVPAAVGMQLASPERRVMLCTGDGSMLYNVQELETIADRGLPIMIVVNNDSAWNMIRCAQTSMYACNYIGTDLPDIDYAQIAKGFGFHAETVTRAAEIVPAYERARDSGGPALVNVVTDKTNYPDAVISFALVEFDGVELDPGNLLKGFWRSRSDGFARAAERVAYIYKSFISG